MPTASWVIVSRETGEAVMETYNRRLTLAVNLDRYRVAPIGEWLGGLNAKIAAEVREGTANA